MQQAFSLQRVCCRPAAPSPAGRNRAVCGDRPGPITNVGTHHSLSRNSSRSLPFSSLHRGHRGYPQLCTAAQNADAFVAPAGAPEPVPSEPKSEASYVPVDNGLSTNGATNSTDSLSSIDGDAPAAAAPKKGGGLMKRAVVGLALAMFGAFTIATGKKTYLAVTCLVVYQFTQEYYGFITSKGISKGGQAPPKFVSIATTILCISISVLTYLLKGKSGSALAVAAFTLLSLNLVMVKKPTYSQLASSLFGLFYCGYLPSFWVKLRMVTAAPLPPAFPLPEVFTSVVKWNLGLLATFASVLCIVAADTGAFFVGKTFGRTKLTDISPKKTVEGAIGGLASSVGAALLCWRLLSWPTTPALAAGLGVCIFFTSLFGDLIESLMKREAGLKDSGNLLPGHGGLLDRFDSYLFTGAFSYFFLVLTL